jgi:hypothetical protein
MARKSNAEIVLSALMRGQEVEIEGRRWCLAEDNTLCTIGDRYPDGDMDKEPESVLLGVDFTVKGFINMCEALTWDEIVIIGANSVLRDMADESIKKRERHSKGHGA